jgi:phospholipid/cholesterol/gamma-HCH transport system permease protein
MNRGTKPARLTAQLVSDGWLRIALAGDWIARAGLPGIEAVEQAVAAANGSMKGLEFDANALGRWNSGLMTLVVKCWELCQQKGIEFRAETLPSGVAALLRLSQAVPEKKDAARKGTRTPFLRRVGESAMASWAGGIGWLTFLGENVLALLNLMRGRAQFRWADVFLVVQECGPRALGIVALINFLIGLILAFVGATQLAVFGAAFTRPTWWRWPPCARWAAS